MRGAKDATLDTVDGETTGSAISVLLSWKTWSSNGIAPLIIQLRLMTDAATFLWDIGRSHAR